MPDDESRHPLDAAALGLFVARVRAERGLTQRQLAERLYVSDKTVSKWERGLSLPSVPLLVPLADALGVSISELMSCEESPGERGDGLAGADRLVTTPLGLPGASVSGRRRALRLATLLGAITLWAVLAASVAFSRSIDTLPRALSDPTVTGGFLMLVTMAYFSFFCRETLPGYYDQNRISFVARGPLRLNLGGLVRVHNGNWPAMCRAARWGAAGAAVLMPVLELALGGTLSDAAIGLAGCAALFVPVVAAAKLNE